MYFHIRDVFAACDHRAYRRHHYNCNIHTTCDSRVVQCSSIRILRILLFFETCVDLRILTYSILAYVNNNRLRYGFAGDIKWRRTQNGTMYHDINVSIDRRLLHNMYLWITYHTRILLFKKYARILTYSILAYAYARTLVKSLVIWHDVKSSTHALHGSNTAALHTSALLSIDHVLMWCRADRRYLPCVNI